MGAKSWTGARLRVFGWRQYAAVPEPREADALREAAEAVAAGVPVGTIAAEWRAARVPTPRGGQWWPQTVEGVLRRASNVPALLPAELHSRVLAVLDDPDREKKWRLQQYRSTSAVTPTRGSFECAGQRPASGLDRKGAGRWIATYLVRCGICGALLTTSKKFRGQTVLRCGRGAGLPALDGERHPTALADHLDALLHAGAIEAWAEARQQPTAAVAEEFALLGVHSRRQIASRYLNAVLEPRERHRRGELRVTRKLT